MNWAIVEISRYTIFCSASVPLASTRWVRMTFSSLCLCSAVNKSQQHKKNSREKYSGTLRIKPGAAGWEARMLPLCYAAPLVHDFLLVRCWAWNSSPVIRIGMITGLHETSFFLNLMIVSLQNWADVGNIIDLVLILGLQFHVMVYLQSLTDV